MEDYHKKSKIVLWMKYVDCFRFNNGIVFVWKVRLHFRPEFLNRLDDIVFFQPLNIKQLSSIIHLQLRSLEERLKEQEITISLTDKAIQSTLKKSYNPGKIHVYFHQVYLFFLNSLWCSSIKTLSWKTYNHGTFKIINTNETCTTLSCYNWYWCKWSISISNSTIRKSGFKFAYKTSIQS